MRRARGSLAALLALVLGIASSPAPAAAADPILVGAGDIADCTQTTDSATSVLLDDIAGTVMTLGDNVYPSGTTADFATCYGPTWGRHRPRTRPAVGNHEYKTADASPYYAYFGSAAGAAGKGWYSYDLGAWHVVVLNSNCAVVGCSTTSSQGTWLRADLAAHADDNVLAYFHHPRYSSGEHGGSLAVIPLWEMLYAAGADLILSGHEHHYERFAPQDPWGRRDDRHGIREFIVGTGGTALRTRSIPAKHSQVFGAAHGVIKLTLHATSYDWSFIPIAGKTFTDHGSGSTHGPPPTRTRRSFPITTDAYVDQARPATRFGGSARLLVDGDTGAGLDREAYLKATVSGLTGRVDRAALRLWVTNPTIDGPTVAATSTGWTGATITWASRAGSTGSVVIDLDRVPSGTWVDVPVTPVVQDDGTFAFRLRPTSGDGLEASSLQGDHPPRLIVDTVPATP